MSWTARLQNWKRQLFDRGRLEHELDAEVEAYADHLTDEYVRAGMTPEEARRAAKCEIGSAELVKEQCRDVRTFHWWDDFQQDLRYGFRQIARNPLMTTAIVLTLALGIAAKVVVFSVVRAVVFRPLAYRQPEQLVQIWQSKLRSATDAEWVSFPDFRDWNRQNRVFQSMAAYRYQSLTLTGEREPEAVVGLYVTGGLFDVLGVQPIIGRTFLPREDEPGSEAVAVISHGLWKRRFGGDPAISGRSIMVDGEPYQVVGVMPESFRFPTSIPSETVIASGEIWLPVRIPPDLDARHDARHGRWDAQVVGAIGRLKSDVTLEQARVDMESIAGNLAREYPGTNLDVGVKLGFMRDYLSRSARPALLMLFGSVGMLLLLACSSIANLLLSRAESRRREMTIRLAIGAGRTRLLRQALTESFLITSIGAAAGLAISYLSMNLVLHLAPLNIPRIDQASIDAHVLLFTCLVTVGTGILFGLAPALAGGPRSAYRSLKEAGLRSTPGKTNLAVRHVLVGGQMALAVVLLTCAGLLIRSFVNVVRLDPGFRSDRVLIGFVVLSQPQYFSAARQVAFFEGALSRIRALPGVESAAVSNSVPLTWSSGDGEPVIEGRTARPGEASGYVDDVLFPQANSSSVSAGYFETMGIPLMAGRRFDERDHEDSPPVAIVSDLAARMYWPGENAIGKRIGVGRIGEEPWLREVVGVVGGTRHFGLEEPRKPEVYSPFLQRPNAFMTLVVRAKGNAQATIRACQRELAVMDPNQAGFGFRPMDDLLSNARARRRFQSLLLAAFAASALFLAAIGIYGVIAYSVVQRTREIGTRIALGASGQSIVAMIMKQGLIVTLAGTAIGLMGSLALSRVLSGLLFGVSPLDPPTLATVVIVLLSVAALSTYLPSRSAARLDPLTALREE